MGTDGTAVSSDANPVNVTHINAEGSNPAGFQISNERGAELPSAGGLGTNMIYLLGITLIGLAGAGFVLKRSRNNVAQQQEA